MPFRLLKCAGKRSGSLEKGFPRVGINSWSNRSSEECVQTRPSVTYMHCQYCRVFHSRIYRPYSAAMWTLRRAMRARETLVCLSTRQRTDSSSTTLPAACLRADLSLVILKVSCFNLLAAADRAFHHPLTAMLWYWFQRGNGTRDHN